jgi:anti-anti-sigma factor
VNLAQLEFEDVPDALVVHVKGEIDMSNVDDIRTEISDRVTPGIGRVVIDMTATTYLDSSGVRLVFDLAQRLQARRQELSLVVTDEALVRRVILLTKLDSAVPLHPSVADALGQ